MSCSNRVCCILSGRCAVWIQGQYQDDVMKFTSVESFDDSSYSCVFSSVAISSSLCFCRTECFFFLYDGELDILGKSSCSIL